MTRAEVSRICRSARIMHGGTKSEMIARLEKLSQFTFSSKFQNAKSFKSFTRKELQTAAKGTGIRRYTVMNHQLLFDRFVFAHGKIDPYKK